MERKTVEANYCMKMGVIMKVNSKIMRSRDKESTVVKITFGKGLGKMVTCKEKAVKLFQKTILKQAKILNRPLKI
jgi:hypothetical protein